MLQTLKTHYRNWVLYRHLSLNLWRRVVYLFLVLAALVTITTSVMVLAEGMSLGDALWLSSTTITTVGYGDLSPKTAIGRITVVVCMYTFAISTFAVLFSEISQYFTLKLDRKLKGLWDWNTMKDHILLINTPNRDAERFLYLLCSEIQKTPQFQDTPIQILTRRYPEGLPEKLKKLKILHRHGESERNESLRSCNVQQAKIIVILSRDYSDTVSDSLTFDVVTRIHELGSKALIIAEATDGENHQRFFNAGANIVLRPHRARPELLVRIMAAPGTEKVIDELFDYDGDHIARVEVEFNNITWADLVCRVVTNGAGVPIAYIDNQDKVVTNPLHSEICSGKGLISVVHEKQHEAVDNISRLFTTV